MSGLLIQKRIELFVVFIGVFFLEHFSFKMFWPVFFLHFMGRVIFVIPFSSKLDI